MSFLSRLFGGRADDDPLQNTPVGGWPSHGEQSPQISLERQVLETFGGRVPFGAPFEAVRAIGRPDAYQSPREGFATLLYDRWGLELEIELGKFVHATYLIGAEHTSEKRPALVLAEPRGPDSRALTVRTTQAELLQRFGEPETRQDLDETVVLYYRAGPLMSEFQLHDGLLTMWDVYLD